MHSRAGIGKSKDYSNPRRREIYETYIKRRDTISDLQIAKELNLDPLVFAQIKKSKWFQNFVETR